MRPTVLFLPGLLCDARLWRDQIAGLDGLVETIVADVSRDDSLDEMARRAIDGMPDQFALCGLSMGGYVAFAVLRLARARVTRLCLMDTSARADTPDQARRRRGLMSLTRTGRFRGVTPRLLPQLVHPDRLEDADLVGDVMDMAERIGRDGFLRQQTAILARPDSRPDLAAIDVPTRVVVGSHDSLTPIDMSREIAEGVPDATLTIVDGSGHLPPMERPATVTAILRDWLA